MDSDRWARIKTLFTVAIDLPKAERVTWLEREVPGDPELLAEVISLLDSHDSAGAFLQPATSAARLAALDANAGTGIGERLGSYRLVEIIGAGGMGDVYKAVRDDDEYRAEVAIKLMRADVRNEIAERRFRSERQILAALDHRNIARLIDGGTTQRGLPYVVMELVEGEPIDRYCDARALDTRARVNLFLQVCSAVSYAHQQLVVHRDLKPNNILVTADGSVKLLDFGIAKLLENDAITGSASQDTRTQFRAMTLEYASPEQVSGGKVTTVSDVYSLGVVLYRLLTGQSPYRTRGGDAARVAEILGDTSPTRPSVIATQDRRVVDDDLDHILLMALRKEPARRYGSVEQFALDLRQYLAGHAVSARRGSFAYRSTKFIRRHRIPLAAGALVLISLSTGLGLAIREARIANAERATAQRHFDRVRTLANKLFDFHEAIVELPGATRAREMLVKTSLEYLDALYAERTTDPALQEELAKAYLRVGQIQGAPYGGNTGDTQAASTSYRRAAELGEALLVNDPGSSRATLLLADIYYQQTYLQVMVQGANSPKESARRATEYAEAAARFVPDAVSRTQLLIKAYWARAMVLGQSGNRAEARGLANRMVAAAEALATADPQKTQALQMLAIAYGNAALLRDGTQSPQERSARAISLSQRSVSTFEKLVALEPSNVAHQTGLAEQRLNLGSGYLADGRYAEALEQFDLAAPALTARARDDADTQARLVKLTVSSHQAWARFHLGREREARVELAATVRDLESMASTYDNLQARYFLAQAQIRLGAMLQAAPQREESRRLLQAGAEGMRAVDKVFRLDEEERAYLTLAETSLARNP